MFNIEVISSFRASSVSIFGIFLVEFMDLNLYLPYFNGPNNGNYEIGMYFLSTFPLGVKKFLCTLKCGPRWENK